MINENPPNLAHTYEESYHAAHLTHDPKRAVVWKVLASYLSAYIPATGDVLEIGAGYCDWINQIAAQHKVAIDLWNEMPKYAADNVETIQHDLSLGLNIFNDRNFDIILGSNILEHFDMDVASRLVADAYRLLRSGGRFILVQPNFRFAYRHYFDDYTHRSVFTDVSLPNLLRSHGFTIERTTAKLMPYSMRNSRFPMWPWLIRLYLHSPIRPFAGQMLVIARKPVTGQID